MDTAQTDALRGWATDSERCTHSTCPPTFCVLPTPLLLLNKWLALTLSSGLISVSGKKHTVWVAHPVSVEGKKVWARARGKGGLLFMTLSLSPPPPPPLILSPWRACAPFPSFMFCAEAHTHTHTHTLATFPTPSFNYFFTQPRRLQHLQDCKG